MKILICTPYGIDEARGNSVAARRLRDGFCHSGHEVFVLDRCEAAGAEGAEERIRTFGPHVGLVMHGWRCAAYFRAVRTVCDAPVIVSLRGTDLNEMMKDRERRPTIREVLVRCDGIAVFSHRAREVLAGEDESLARKTRVIPNGITPPKLEEQGCLSWAGPEGGVVFVGVAGIRNVKCPSWVMENLSVLRQGGADIHYVHAGPILEEDEGRRFLSICREEDWIHYAGELPHDQVSSLLQAGHVFVSASRSEGMPHSVREAMLAGLPCLLSDIEGHRVLARPGREALFFSGQRDFLRQAAALAQSPGLRQRLAERAKVRAERSGRNGKEIEAYLRFFVRLAKGNGRAEDLSGCNGRSGGAQSTSRRP